MVKAKTYPKYKDSGVPWFGEVPSHWQTPRLGSVFRERKESNKTNDVTKILSVMKDIGVIPYEEKGRVGNKCSEDITRYKIVRPGDIVANCMNIIIGSVGLSKYTGCLSPVYYVLTPRSQEDDSRYFDYVFKIKSFQLSLVRLGNGILAHRMRIPMELLKCEKVPQPPVDEQKAIVEYLDAVNKVICRYIREKQKVIKLLNEQKQSMVDRAITRGVNPNTRFKSSGVDWLGDIPEHWEVNKLKRIVYFAPSRSESGFSKDSKELVVFLPMERISHDGQIDCSELRPVSEVWQGYTYFRRDDVVIAKITPCFENGKGACLDQLKSEFGFGTSEFIVLRAKENEVYPRYLYLITTTRMFRIFGSEAMTGAAGQQRVSSAFVKNFMVPLPPKDEQEAIIEVIHEQSAKYDLIIRQAKDEIDLLREYRFRLISDVVTGKMDVRGIKLPETEDITDSEPIKDQETLEDVEDTEEVVNADE